METKEGETALHIVSRGKYDSEGYRVGITRLLLERGGDVNARSKNAFTPLHSAVLNGRFEVARFLLDHGANTKLETEEGATALHIMSPGEYNSEEHRVGIARLLLERGGDVNARSKNGCTPLHLAVFHGRLEVTRFLLEHGANAKLEIEGGETVLDIASRSKYDSEEHRVGMVRLLLEHGGDINARNKNACTPLHSAVLYGRLEVVRVLLDNGANAKLEIEEGATALHIVSPGKYDSEKHRVGIVRLLLERGGDVNARNKNAFTPLHLAVFHGRLEVVRVLLDNGANAMLETEEGATALHIVSPGKYDSEKHRVGIARLLLERGGDVNARSQAYTPLHLAVFNGRLEVARVLLDHGASTKLETKEGATALHIVSLGKYDSEEHRVGMVRLFLEHGGDVNARSKNTFTPLHVAVFNGKLEVARVLLDNGANAKLEIEGGETALHIMSRGKYDSEEHRVGIVRLLLERGADVSARSKNAFTPLHSAVLNGRLEVARVLLDRDANAKLETKEGETALHIVSRGEYDSEEHRLGIARLLLEHGVDVHAPNKYLSTPLHQAAFGGRLEITQLLLDCGANPNVENKQGRTPLHLVSRSKQTSHGVGIARLLLERGVDVDAQEKNSWTLLHSAVFNGRLDIAQVLSFLSYF